MSASKLSIVEETNLGIYVWEMPNGQIIADEDHNFLSIASKKGDIGKIRQIAEVAASYVGPGVGRAIFLAGERKITDAEYEEQLIRQSLGLVPDPYDYRAHEEEARGNK